MKQLSLVRNICEGKLVVRNIEFERFELRDYHKHSYNGFCFTVVDACRISDIRKVSEETLQKRFPTAEAIFSNCFPAN